MILRWHGQDAGKASENGNNNYYLKSKQNIKCGSTVSVSVGVSIRSNRMSRPWQQRNPTGTVTATIIVTALLFAVLDVVPCRGFAMPSTSRQGQQASFGLGWSPMKDKPILLSTSSLASSTQKDTEKQQQHVKVSNSDADTTLTKNDDSLVSASTASTSTSSLLNVKTSDVLSLESIRSTLIRQEETIIFAIIERAAFRSNCIVYEKASSNNESFGCLGIPHGIVVGSSISSSSDHDDDLQQLSFMEFMLLSTVSAKAESSQPV
jgi:hypothetical protein